MTPAREACVTLRGADTGEFDLRLAEASPNKTHGMYSCTGLPSSVLSLGIASPWLKCLEMVGDAHTESYAASKNRTFYANSPAPTIFLNHSLFPSPHSPPPPFITMTAHAYPYFLAYSPQER